MVDLPNGFWSSCNRSESDWFRSNWSSSFESSVANSTTFLAISFICFSWFMSSPSLDNVETVNNLTENNVLAVQPRAWNSSDEELGSVGVWTSVGHGKQTWLGVLVHKVLVWELGSIDTLTSGTVEVGEITTLQHEVWNDSVEDGVLVTETLLSSAQSSEVFSGFWNVLVQREDDLSQWFAFRVRTFLNSESSHQRLNSRSTYRQQQLRRMS
ncbi:hypothetical protein OGAPHI_007005 [Ogataea philodendri]|uniref:Uncharacterized protein n=1 Tax=Ogataea philodendri TaxID=1378263 RepID=A0A9P8NWM7_9ASCO|nr:uncharacterized protein OGAPHI_007005 [Ogataea philodendri]KAH3660419.1 hypothetical protein OGAPHI_007005 [Ogataea philodendri]